MPKTQWGGEGTGKVTYPSIPFLYLRKVSLESLLYGHVFLYPGINIMILRAPDGSSLWLIHGGRILHYVNIRKVRILHKPSRVIYLIRLHVFYF